MMVMCKFKFLNKIYVNIHFYSLLLLVGTLQYKIRNFIYSPFFFLLSSFFFYFYFSFFFFLFYSFCFFILFLYFFFFLVFFFKFSVICYFIYFIIYFFFLLYSYLLKKIKIKHHFIRDLLEINRINNTKKSYI